LNLDESDEANEADYESLADVERVIATNKSRMMELKPREQSASINKHSSNRRVLLVEPIAQVASLCFHNVRGRNIELSRDMRIARRAEKSFCDAIVFSDRPVRANEPIYLRVLKLSSFWNGMLRLGFTRVNPSTFTKARRIENDDIELPKYVYPDLTNKVGFWAGSMPEQLLKENDVLYFYYTLAGDIHYGINDNYHGLFMSGLDLNGDGSTSGSHDRSDNRTAPHMWAMLDIYGNTLAVELLNNYRGDGHSNYSSTFTRTKREKQELEPSHRDSAAETSALYEYLVDPLVGQFDQADDTSSNNATNDLTPLQSISTSAKTSNSTRNTKVSANKSSTATSNSNISTNSSCSLNSTTSPSSISSSSISLSSSSARECSALFTSDSINSRTHSPRSSIDSSASTTTMPTVIANPNARSRESNGSNMLALSNHSSKQQASSGRPASSTLIENDFSNMLISYRRLCICNHLNETLHSSINLLSPSFNSSFADAAVLGGNESAGSSSNSNAILSGAFLNFYESIPILLHEPISSSTVKTNEQEATQSEWQQYYFLKSIHGKNVRIGGCSNSLAYRPLKTNASSSGASSCGSGPTRNAYAFLDQPLETGKNICVQIVGVENAPDESDASLTIGCTTWVPSKVKGAYNLPDDSHDLLDRPEYWIVHKNLFLNKSSTNTSCLNRGHESHNKQEWIGDELCFHMNESNGNLAFYVNRNLITDCLFSVDVTQTLWFFFDLCGRTSAIRLLPSCDNGIPNNTLTPASQIRSISVSPIQSVSSQPIDTVGLRNQSAESKNRRRGVNSALIDFYKTQMINLNTHYSEALIDSASADSKALKSQNANRKKLPSNVTKSNSGEECRICWDAPIECVFYSCGHMCICWKW
jgi:hypothetical protein